MTFDAHNPDDEKSFSTLNLNDAKRKIMDYIAGRNHTEKELRQKLAKRCDENTIDQAIDWAKKQNWLAAPAELTKEFANQLSRRGQGVHKINQKLAALGLDEVRANADEELAKATRLALTKWSPDDFSGLEFEAAQKLKSKIVRFLSARGFDVDIISSILQNELKAGALSNEQEY